MEILKIKDGKGLFINPLKSDFKEESYVSIDKIEKEDIIDIIKYRLDNEIEIGKCDDVNPIHNPAHKIVYECIYNKLINLDVNSIKAEVDSVFEEAELKYTKNANDTNN